MKILTTHLTKGLIVLAFSIGMASVQVFAEEGQVSKQDSNPAVSQRRSARQTKIEALKKLKAENPEEFARVVKERKDKIKQKLQELKEKDPEKYKEVTEKIRERRRERLERLHQENPEKFRETMREKAEKLRELKEKDPARYVEFMKNHPRLAERAARRGKRGEDSGIGRHQGERN